MLKKFFATLALFFFLALIGAGGVVWVFWHHARDLPDYRQLADHEPPITTRVHAGDGRLLGEFALEKRTFVPIRATPRLVINAILAAEDKTFYSHPGVDIPGIVSAALRNVKNIGSNRRPTGASTITQQVAKNFLLTNEVSFKRKIKEVILAFRIERAFSKERILELYLNEIYLGQGSYGFAAAAMNYFNKSMNELTIAEAAFLAALPKAPNNYNPDKRPRAAKIRRDWVIGRMAEDGHITEADAETAKLEPLETRERTQTEFVKAGFFVEEVRRELMDRYGDKALYGGGLSVRTTLDPRLQDIARRALRSGLRGYDRRHGWRGPISYVKPDRDWAENLAKVKPPKGLEPFQLAVTLKTRAKHAEIGLIGGERGVIPFSELKWARPWLEDQKLGGAVKRPSDVIKPGDVVAVEPFTPEEKEDDKKKKKNAESEEKKDGPKAYALRQIPEIDGSLVALDPHTGRVLAMVGGYDSERSEFNRATQARRQPGSAFKPFVYLAALDTGYTPSTQILDAPFVIDQGPGMPKWRPANYTKKFYGPSTMRLGIEKSRNLMTVRLAQTIGMEKVAEYAERFGIVRSLKQTLSMSLGAGETTLIDLTNAYATLVNGCRRIEPTMIDRIQDRHGLTIFRHDDRTCEQCRATYWVDQPVPDVPDTRESIADPASCYQVVSMLQGVVQRGTGRRIAKVGKPLAGKTGTTNRSLDTWFVGFAPDLAVGVFVGFDDPRTLGRKETGSSVAAPIFRDFMADALEGKPTIDFRVPPGVRLVRVRASDGQLARPDDARVILEAFKPGTEPTGQEEVLRGSPDDGEAAPRTGTGGLY